MYSVNPIPLRLDEVFEKLRKGVAPGVRQDDSEFLDFRVNGEIQLAAHRFPSGPCRLFGFLRHFVR